MPTRANDTTGLGYIKGLRDIVTSAELPARKKNVALAALHYLEKRLREHLQRIEQLEQRPAPPEPAARPYVLVCTECGTAACAQGVFYCERYREAGLRFAARDELELRRLEDPRFWDRPVDIFPRRG